MKLLVMVLTKKTADLQLNIWKSWWISTPFLTFEGIQYPLNKEFVLMHTVRLIWYWLFKASGPESLLRANWWWMDWRWGLTDLGIIFSRNMCTFTAINRFIPCVATSLPMFSLENKDYRSKRVRQAHPCPAIGRLGLRCMWWENEPTSLVTTHLG